MGRLKLIIGVNDLATMNPELAAEWHPVKNGDLTPDHITYNSDKTIWWQCQYGHEWSTTVGNRIRAHSGCPFCAGQRVIKGVNDLLTITPELALEWHPTKNGNLTPDMVMPYSHKRVWWLGSCGHEWQAKIANRNNGRGCPICHQESQTSFAEQAIYFYLKKYYLDTVNRDISIGKELDVFIPSLRVAVEYDGEYYHKGKIKVKKDLSKNLLCQAHNIRIIRIREQGCPKLDGCEIIIRSGYDDKSLEDALRVLLNQLEIEEPDIDIKRDKDKINKYIVSLKEGSLAVTHPELVSEWHPTRNGRLKPNMVMPGSHKQVWWLGKCGHEWKAVISNRVNGNGCPYCSSQKVLKGFNDLETLNPELAIEWHPTKNGDLKPDMLMPNSNKKAWWIGKCGHEWQAVISSRSNGCGCPYCDGKKVWKGFNDLATTNPERALEWHPTKNGDLKPDMVMRGTRKKVWWLGKCGHEWQAAVSDRSCGYQNGCPYCSGRKVLKGFNDLLTVYPKLASEWNYDKNRDLKPDEVTRGSGKKVWWKCNKGHEWQDTILHRSRNSNCPYCSGKRKLSQ